MVDRYALERPGFSKRESSVKTPEPDDSAEVWYAYFEQELGETLEDNKKLTTYWDYYIDFNKFINDIFNNFKNRIFIRCRGWPREVQGLYRFNGILYVLTELEKITVRRGGVMFQDYSDRYEKELIDIFPGRLPDKFLENTLPVLVKAADLVRSCLLNKDARVFDWVFLYRLIWSNVFAYPLLLEKEIKILRQSIKKYGRGTHNHVNATIALAHLLVLKGEDGAAREILTGLDNKELDYIVFYLVAFSKSEQWERLLEWLRWAAPKLDTGTERDMEIFGRFWSEAAEYAGASGEYIANLKRWLPRSRYIYGEFLLHRKQFTEWADLNISLWDLFPGDISAGELGYVEDKEPSAALPIYHRWAILLIEEKNRGAYQGAVKVLKKIRTIYNRLKMKDEWETFIQRLVARYPRSRALHEELRKGKLI